MASPEDANCTPVKGVLERVFPLDDEELKLLDNVNVNPLAMSARGLHLVYLTPAEVAQKLAELYRTDNEFICSD